MKTRTLIIILVLVIAGLLTVAILVKNKKKDKVLEVTAESATIQTIVETVTASGKIYPQTEVKISSDVSGEIISLPVIEGQAVSKGQLLAKIKPDNYQALIEQSQANVDNARAQVSNAKARLKQAEAQLEAAKLTSKRAQQLHDAKAMSDQDYEQAQTGLKTAQAEYDAAKFTIEGAEYTVKGALAALKDAQNNVNKTTIYAPAIGKISLLNVEQGEKVVGTLQMSGTEMMRIADLDNLEVRVDVSENEIVRVKVGDTADIEVDAYLNKKFKGIVSEVSSSSKGIATSSVVSTDQATNYVVKVKMLRESYAYLLDENPIPFRPGMSATVEVKTKTQGNVIAVPIQAVTTRVDKNKKQDDTKVIVFVIDVNGKTTSRKVETGIQNDSYIEITNGLSKGDKVITGPYNLLSKELKDGDMVKIIDKKKMDAKDEDATK